MRVSGPPQSGRRHATSRSWPNSRRAVALISRPPHVAAARKMSQPPGRLITYVMTTAGPEPSEEQAHPLDYEHYVDKQIRPVAEPVLSLLGLDFNVVLGGDQQLELF